MCTKFDRLEKILQNEEFTITDMLKILCAFTARMMRDTNSDYTDIMEVIHGEGMKFRIKVTTE